ncbi:MAG: hypothetical protein FWH05_07220 [Oscillospiraceae bacterium]|nr:hypothetical protein [Oscillospiraceae bacterium]
MFATGDFDRLRCDVMNRYEDDLDTPITFGVLIADYDQSLSRKYILNYLDIFNNLSGDYIDFFIPGYITYDRHDTKKVCRIGEENYYFARELFHEFVGKLKIEFGVAYEYNPILVLLELTRTDFYRSRKMIIELDSQNNDIKRTGVLFQRIFEIARKYTSLDDFSYGMRKTYIKGSVLDSFVNALDNSIITEINARREGIRQYRIR